jgi:hypothetical protein
MRRADGKIIAYTDFKKTVRDYGYPWYDEPISHKQITP